MTATQLVEQGDPPPAPQTQTTAGPFTLSGLVTPATYAVRVESPGFETQDFEVDLGAGENRVLNTVRLGASAGSLAGVVTDEAGQPLGARHGLDHERRVQTEVLTPTSGAVGAFVVENLATPRTYIVTFSREGFGTRTVALDLGPGEARTGVDVAPTGGSGTLRGAVSDPVRQPGRRGRDHHHQRAVRGGDVDADVGLVDGAGRQLLGDGPAHTRHVHGDGHEPRATWRRPGSWRSRTPVRSAASTSC